MKDLECELDLQHRARWDGCTLLISSYLAPRLERAAAIRLHAFISDALEIDTDKELRETKAKLAAALDALHRDAEELRTCDPCGGEGKP